MANLEKFMELAKSRPGIHFITVSDAFEIYRDGSEVRRFRAEELRNVCEKCLYAINYQVVGEEV